MRRLAGLGLLTLAALASAAPADAQQYRRVAPAGEGLVVNVRPRSWLDAGKVVRPGDLDHPVVGARAQVASYLNIPPYLGQRDRLGEGVLPDPITNGPFVGARNPFGPVDFGLVDPLP